MVRAAFPDKPYVNLEFPDDREFAQDDPRGFLRRIPNGAILDEIQRVPDLVSYIQGIVDQKKMNGMFILTGSQQFEVSASIAQSLAGRTALLKLLPFSVEEIKKSFHFSHINQLIYNGFYPRVYDQNLNPTQALADYFETYVERDLRQLIQVKNLSLFRKFVKLCAGRVGQILNLNNISNDLGASHTTVREWLSILEASYIIFLLQPFHANIKKRLVKSPKLYFYDVGLASYLLGIESLSHVEVHPLRGNLFENLVVAELLKYRYNRGKRNNLNFYRDHQGNEVDVIYNIANQVLPIEIKAAETLTRDFFRSFGFFQKLFPNLIYGKALIYGGERRQMWNDIHIAPVGALTELLNELVND